MKLEGDCNACEGCEAGERMDVVSKFERICLTDPVPPIKFSESLVREAVIDEALKDEEVTKVRSKIKDIIFDFLSEGSTIQFGGDVILNEIDIIYDELSKMGFYKIWDYESLKAYFLSKVSSIYQEFGLEKDVPISISPIQKGYITALLNLLGSKSKVPFYLTNLLATRREVEGMPLSSIWRETTERTVRAKCLFEDDFIPKFYDFNDKLINGEFDNLSSDDDVIVDEDFISKLNDLDVESLNASIEDSGFSNSELLHREDMELSLFDGESSEEIKPDKHEFYLAKFNTFFNWNFSNSSENQVNKNKVNFRDRIFQLLKELLSSLHSNNTDDVSAVDFPKTFKEALKLISQLKDDFVYSDKNEPFKINKLERELVDLMHSFYKVFEELEIAHRGKFELNELGGKMNEQILNILQEDICPNIADCNDPSDLAKIIAETLPFNEETFKIFVDAIVKLDFMLVADILAMVHSEENVLRFSSYLRDKLSMHVAKDKAGNVILNPNRNGEIVDQSIVIKDLCVHDGKSFQSIFEKMIPQAFAKPESIGDKIRFMIVLSDKDSEDLSDGLKNFKVGEYQPIDLDQSNCLNVVSKVHGILCAILGTNIDKLELQSSYITGGTKIFSTGDHFALHCTFRVRLYDKEKKKMVSYPVECQIRLAGSDPKGDHGVYRENKIKHIKERYGINFSFGDFLIAALSTFKNIKKDTIDLSNQDEELIREILLKSFESFQHDGKLLNENVFIEIAETHGISKLESMFKSFLEYFGDSLECEKVKLRDAFNALLRKISNDQN